MANETKSAEKFGVEDRQLVSLFFDCAWADVSLNDEASRAAAHAIILKYDFAIHDVLTKFGAKFLPLLVAAMAYAAQHRLLVAPEVVQVSAATRKEYGLIAKRIRSVSEGGELDNAAEELEKAVEESKTATSTDVAVTAAAKILLQLRSVTAILLERGSEAASQSGLWNVTAVRAVADAAMAERLEIESTREAEKRQVATAQEASGNDAANDWDTSVPAAGAPQPPARQPRARAEKSKRPAEEQRVPAFNFPEPVAEDMQPVRRFSAQLGDLIDSGRAPAAGAYAPRAAPQSTAARTAVASQPSLATSIAPNKGAAGAQRRQQLQAWIEEGTRTVPRNEQRPASAQDDISGHQQQQPQQQAAGAAKIKRRILFEESDDIAAADLSQALRGEFDGIPKAAEGSALKTQQRPALDVTADDVFDFGQDATEVQQPGNTSVGISDISSINAFGQEDVSVGDVIAATGESRKPARNVPVLLSVPPRSQVDQSDAPPRRLARREYYLSHESKAFRRVELRGFPVVPQLTAVGAQTTAAATTAQPKEAEPAQQTTTDTTEDSGAEAPSGNQSTKSGGTKKGRPATKGRR